MTTHRHLPMVPMLVVGAMLLSACEHSPLQPAPPRPNQRPIITSLTANPSPVSAGLPCVLTVEATDPDGDVLSYAWQVSAGQLSGTGATVTWTAPMETGVAHVSVEVSDAHSGKASRSLDIQVTSQTLNNRNPVITEVTVSPAVVFVGDSAQIEVKAEDPDGDPLTYAWTKSGGTLRGQGPAVTWISPNASGDFILSVSVSDGRGGSALRYIAITVKVNNGDPVIESLTANPTTIRIGETTTLTVRATDPNGDPLSYYWSAVAGVFLGSGPTVQWTAPSGPVCCAPGPYEIKATVTDTKGGTSEKSVIVYVII